MGSTCYLTKMFTCLFLLKRYLEKIKIIFTAELLMVEFDIFQDGKRVAGWLTIFESLVSFLLWSSSIVNSKPLSSSI